MRKKFKSEDSIEREKILEKFEAVCAMFALDLIGVKVFGYSDETAEAVASGEKLLKESETIYESFADMMSPEDAKRYLDFLERWKQRRIDKCRAGRSGKDRCIAGIPEG